MIQILYIILIMKRVTYISHFAKTITKEEINQIGEISVRNNQRDGLTGVLFTYKNIFYQIIEGPEDKLDARLEKILQDPRHTDIYILKVEKNIPERKYSNWAMNTVILEEAQEYLIEAISEMLDAITQGAIIFEKYIPEHVIKSLRLGNNPLEETVKQVEKVIVFGDLFCSSTFGEKLKEETFYNLLESFFTISIDKIHESGGEVLRLMGDGFIAIFDSNQVSPAVESIRNISTQLKELRESYESKSPFSLVFAGFGMSKGKVLQGNLGSKYKKDYTVIGDPVNTAARLQSVSRKIQHTLVFDENVAKELPKNNLKYIGRYTPKGKLTKVPLYTLKDKEMQIELSYNEIYERIKALETNK